MDKTKMDLIQERPDDIDTLDSMLDDEEDRNRLLQHEYELLDVAARVHMGAPVADGNKAQDLLHALIPPEHKDRADRLLAVMNRAGLMRERIAFAFGEDIPMFPMPGEVPCAGATDGD